MNSTNKIDGDITQRITAVLFSAKTLHLTAMMAIFTVTPVIAVQLTGSDAAAGVPGTAVLVGRAAGAYPVGWIMDRIGRRIGLSAGFLAAIIGAVMGALAVLQSAFWILVAGSLFIGMSHSALEQTRYIAAEIQPAGRRTKTIGLIVFAGAVASLGGRLVMELSWRFTEITGIARLAGPWLLATVLMVIGLLLNQLLLRPDPLLLGQRVTASDARACTDTIKGARPMGMIFRHPNVILAAAVMALAQLSMTVVMVVTPLHMNYAGYSTLSMSTALMLHTLGMFAFSGLTGWLISLIGQSRVVVLGTLLLVGAGLVGYSAYSISSIYIAVSLLGLGWNLCYISGSTMLSDELISQERGRAQGICEVVVGVTAAIGSLASGTIYSGYGYGGGNAVALVSAVVLVVTLGFMRWTQTRTASIAP